MPNNWAEWDKEHGHGGGSTTSAERIAAQIRGSLGHSSTADHPKTTEIQARGSKSTVSRAAGSRSTSHHVAKKDLKAKAPVKGEIYAGDSMKTKIRMAEYGRKKKAAVAADPVDKKTPKVEIKANPHRPTGLSATAERMSKEAKASPSSKSHLDAMLAHTKAANAAGALGRQDAVKYHVSQAVAHNKASNDLIKSNASIGSLSANRIADTIRRVHSEHGSATGSDEPTHAPGSIEDLANQADAATRLAHADSSVSSHQKAAAAHRTVTSVTKYGENSDVNRYHTLMARHHSNVVSGASAVNSPGVTAEHVDSKASAFPNSPHYLLSGFMDTESRRRADRSYNAVPNVSDGPLSDAQKTSVQRYTGSSYTTINGHLRGTNPIGDPATLKKTQSHVKNLDAAFAAQAPLTHDTVTYRGVSQPDTMFGDVGSRVGSEFEDKGYGSSASHASIANGFVSGGALIRILNPKGSRVLKPSDVGVFGDKEREILLPRGTRYHVAADRVVIMHDGSEKRMIDLIRK